jgi:hypothetical protein
MMSFCARELWPCDGCKVGRLLSGRWAEEYIELRDVWIVPFQVNKVFYPIFLTLELGWFVECRCCPGTLRSVVCCTAPSTTVNPIPTNKQLRHRCVVLCIPSAFHQTTYTTPTTTTQQLQRWVFSTNAPRRLSPQTPQRQLGRPRRGLGLGVHRKLPPHLTTPGPALDNGSRLHGSTL